MNMASHACNLNLIKVIMLCCNCCCSTFCYATYRCYTVQHTCSTEAPQPPVRYQCYMLPQIATIATLHEVPRYSIGTTLPYSTQNSAQFLMVVHPASAAALQWLGRVNTCHYFSTSVNCISPTKVWQVFPNSVHVQCTVPDVIKRSRINCLLHSN